MPEMRIANISKHLYGLLICICIMAVVLGNPSVSRAAYSILHSVGYGVNGSLTLSGSTLYGMTTGIITKVKDAGTIFQINTDGTGYMVLYSFGSVANDGANPQGDLTLSGSTLYGMTYVGGDNGYGTIFQINTDGTGYQVLHSFGGGSDQGYPNGSLTLSGSTLYGMTSGFEWMSGVSIGAGTIFQINTDGTGYKVLHSFGDGSDGACPYGSLTLSGSTLFGMAGSTIFQMNTDGTGYKVLHKFAGPPNDGDNPWGSLTLSGSTLYGMTESGGANPSAYGGLGTIFEINTDGTGYQVLYSFSGGSDGANPNGALTPSGSTLYGMTVGGGKAKWGVIFQINTDGTGYMVLHDFSGKKGDGAPSGSLTLSDSKLYGMTCGGVFSLTVGVTATVPGAPAGVTARAGNAQATVSFKLPANGGSPITSCTATSNPGSITGTGAGSPITVAGLTNGTAYTFAVTATNAVGTGPASKPSNKVTPVGVPGAPTIVSVTPENAEAKVSFKAPASNGSPITPYTVTSSAGQTAKGARSPITVKGLTNGTSYTFTVTATNKAGTGPASSASTPVTPTK
jgi:large repetitive protein